jgi:hypothetical protein
MKDYQTRLEHLRKEAAETRLIADLAPDKAKRETFAKLADHLKALADELERAMAAKRSKRIDNFQTGHSPQAADGIRPGTPPLSSPPAVTRDLDKKARRL